MENVTHEDAVATLKSVTDQVTLVIQKTSHIIMQATAITTPGGISIGGGNTITGGGLSHTNSHSTGAVNNIGQSVVDFGNSSAISTSGECFNCFILDNLMMLKQKPYNYF